MIPRPLECNHFQIGILNSPSETHAHREHIVATMVGHLNVSPDGVRTIFSDLISSRRSLHWEQDQSSEQDALEKPAFFTNDRQLRLTHATLTSLIIHANARETMKNLSTTSLRSSCDG